MPLNASGKSKRPSSPVAGDGAAKGSKGDAAATPWPALIPMGHHEGKPAIPLMRPVTIVGSRQNAHLHLLSRQISKAHAILISHDGKVYIRDLASRTHVFINGVEVREADLVHGDEIKLGSFVFKYQAASGMKQKPRPDETPEAQLGITGEPYPLSIDQRVLLIGRRSICDVPLMEDSCSTAHAVIFAMGGKRYVRDLGSRTGTFVNGQTVRQQELRFGDTVKVGETHLEYQAVAATEAAVSEVDEFEDLVGTAPLVGSDLDFETHDAPAPVEAARTLDVEQGEPLPAADAAAKTIAQDALHASEADLDLDGDLEPEPAVPAPIDTIGIPILDDTRARTPLAPGGISLAPQEPMAVEADDLHIEPEVEIEEPAASESVESEPFAVEEPIAKQVHEPIRVESRWADSERPHADGEALESQAEPELESVEHFVEAAPQTLASEPEEAVRSAEPASEVEPVEPEATADAAHEDAAIPLSEDELLADMGSPVEAIEPESVAEAAVPEPVEAVEAEPDILPPVIEPAAQEPPVAASPTQKRGWFGWAKRREEKPAVAASDAAAPADLGEEPALLDEPVDLPMIDEESTTVTEPAQGSTEISAAGSLDFGDGPEASLSTSPAHDEPHELTYDDELADLTDLYPPEPQKTEEVPTAELPLEDVNESEEMVDAFNIESEPATEELEAGHPPAHEPITNEPANEIDEDDDLNWDLPAIAEADGIEPAAVDEKEIPPQEVLAPSLSETTTEMPGVAATQVSTDSLPHEPDVVTSSTHEERTENLAEAQAEEPAPFEVAVNAELIEEAHEQSGQPESLVPTEEIPAMEAAESESPHDIGIETSESEGASTDQLLPEVQVASESKIAPDSDPEVNHADKLSLDEVIADGAPLDLEQLERESDEVSAGVVQVVEPTEPTSESAFPLDIDDATPAVSQDEAGDHQLTAAELALSDSTFGHQVEEFIGQRIDNPIVVAEGAEAPVEQQPPAVPEEHEPDQTASMEVTTAPDLRDDVDIKSDVSEAIESSTASESPAADAAPAPTTADLVYEELVDFGEPTEAAPPPMRVEFEAEAWLGDPVTDLPAVEEPAIMADANSPASAAALAESVDEFVPVAEVPAPAPSIAVEPEAEPLAAYPELTDEPSLPEFDDLELIAHAAPAAPVDLPSTTSSEAYEPEPEAPSNEPMPAMHLPGMSLFDDSGAIPDFVSGMPLQLRELPPPPPTFGRVQVSFGQEAAQPLLDDPREPGPFEQLTVDLDQPLGVTQLAAALVDEPENTLTGKIEYPPDIEEELPAIEAAEPEPEIVEEPPIAEIEAPEPPPAAPVTPPAPPARTPFQNRLRVPPPPRRGKGLKAPAPIEPMVEESSGAPAGFGEAAEVFGGLVAPAGDVDVFAQGLSADLSNDPFLGGAVRQPPVDPSEVLTNNKRKLRDNRKPPRTPSPDDSAVAAMAGELADHLGAPPVPPRSTMRSAPGGAARDRAASRFRNAQQSEAIAIAGRPPRGPIVEPPKLPPRRGRRVGVLLAIMLAAIIASFVVIFVFMKQHIAMSASMAFENYTRLNHDEQLRVQDQQNARISSAELRDLARHLKPKTVSDGFLGDPVEFGKNISRVNWSENGVLTFKFDGTERADIDRVRAVMKALYVMDQDLVDSAGRTKNTLRTLQSTIDQKHALLERLKERRDIAVHRVDQPPSAEQMKTMAAEKAVAEKAWKEAWAKRYGAEVELKQLEQASSLSQSSPSDSATDKSAMVADSTLQEIQKSLDSLNDRLATARNTTTEQAESARKALDSALEQFQQSTNVVQGLIKDNPELSKFVSAVQRLQETTQKLSGDLLDRQQKSYEHLLEEKRYLDDRLSARRKELWDADHDIQRLKKDVAMRERGRGAAVAYEYNDKAAELQKQMDEQLGKIEQRKMELESDPILSTLNEFSTKRQQEIDASQSLLAADRKKAEALTKEMEKDLGQLLPTVEKLPDSQKALAQQMSSKMEIVANARKVYAEALESKNVEANSSLRLLEAAVRDKKQKLEDRKKTLASMGSQQMSAREQDERQRLLDEKRAQFDKLTKAETAAYDSYIEKERATRVASTDVGYAAKLREEVTQATDDYFHLRDSELPQLDAQLKQTEKLAGVFAFPMEPKVHEPAAMADQRMIYGLGSSAAIALVFSVLFAVTGGKHLPAHSPGEYVNGQAAHADEPPIEDHPGSPDDHWEQSADHHEEQSVEESPAA